LLVCVVSMGSVLDGEVRCKMSWLTLSE
jgi:hypothetical protein